MRIVFVNGRALSGDWRELREALTHPATLTLFVAGMLSFRLLPFASDVPRLSPRVELLFWAHVLLLYTSLYLGIAALFQKAGRTLWTPAVQGLLAAVLTVTGKSIYWLNGVPPADPVTMIVFWLFLWAMLLFFELIFVTFLLDNLRYPPASAATAGDAEPMTVLFISGRRATMRFRDVYAVLLHPITVGLTLAVIIGMAAMHPYPLIRRLDLNVATQLWVQVLIVFYVGFVVQAWLCQLTRLTFVVPLALLMVALAATLTSGWFLAVATGVVATFEDLVAYTLVHWAVLVLVEFLIVTYALDRILRREAGSADPTPIAGAPQSAVAVAPTEATARRLIDDVPALRQDTANPARPAPAVSPGGASSVRPALTLQGISVPADEVLAVTSEEHYLRVLTRDRVRLLRGRMLDVEAQMPPGLGLRVHRSHWVAARSVAGLRRADTGWSLKLICGLEVPVARSRQAAVRAWVRELGLDG